MKKESDKISEILNRGNTITSSLFKDVIVGIGTKPGPLELPDFDEYMKNVMNADAKFYEDVMNTRKKLLMEKLKERRIMKRKNKNFNYEVNGCLESDIENAVEGAKALPIDSEDEEDNYYDIYIVDPIDPEAGDENQPYSGWIAIWKNDDNTYSITFFLAYYCGDDFFVDEEIVPFGDDEKLKTTIQEMVETYSEFDTIDKLIKEQMEKERK